MLDVSAADLTRWETAFFDRFAGTRSRSIVLFGAGGLGRKTLRGLRGVGIEPLALADNNQALQGRTVDGLTVLSPKTAAERFGRDAVFVVTIFMVSAPGAFEPVRSQLKALGCDKVLSFVPLFWKYPNEFLPHYAYDLPHRVPGAAPDIRAAWQLLEDDGSRREYLAQLRWRLDPEYGDIPAPASHTLYFAPDLYTRSEREVFIDCGGYAGDTVQSFLTYTGNQFAKIVSFEPDPANFERMAALVARQFTHVAEKIILKQLAVGARSEVLHFDAQGAASSTFSQNGSLAVRSEPLDHELAGEAPTFVKMDIEGAEIGALEGAAQTIRKHRPILAISAYHVQDHLWRIPLCQRSVEVYQRGRFKVYHP